MKLRARAKKKFRDRIAGKCVGAMLSRAESGQAAVEFALIATVLVLMVTVPLDLFSYANTAMTLNSAATEAASSLTSDNLSSDYALAVANGMYSDRLQNLSVNEFIVSAAETEHEYPYHVYSSDLASEPVFSNRFESRDSNYHSKTVTLQLTCDWHAVTPLGSLFCGPGTITLTSDSIAHDIYTSGYRE